MIAKAECPEEFQERLTEAAGTNPYGDPNFRIAWSQSETFRAGGHWDFDRYGGYREVFLGNGSPIPPKYGYWMILEWTPPTHSEAVHDYLNRDETGLQTLGHFQSSGTYQVALKLQAKEMRNGTLEVTSVPLDSDVLDFIIPIILLAQKISPEKRRMMAVADRAKAEDKQAKQLEAMAHSARAPFNAAESISFSGQKNRNSALAQRMNLIEQQWSWAMKNIKHVKKGFGQGNFLS